MKILSKKKGIVLFILLSLFVVLSANIKNVDLNKRALVIGVGIDAFKGGYELTIQTYAAKQLSDSSPDESEALTVSAEGKTMREAVENLNVKTGKTLSFALCYVVIFGGEAAERGVMDSLNFMLNETDAVGNAALLYTASSAKEIMKISSPINSGSMMLLHDMLSDKQSKPYKPKTVKDFYADYFSHSGASVMPVLKKIEGGRDAENNNEGADDKERKEYYEISSSAIFKKDKFLFETDADETFAIGLLSRGRAKGVFVMNFGERSATFKTERKKLREKYSVSDTLYNAEIKVFLTAAVSENGKGSDGLNSAQNLKNADKTNNENTTRNAESEIGNTMQNLKNADKNEYQSAPQTRVNRNAPTDEEIKAVEEKLKRDILSLLDKCGETDADIFALNDKFYQRFGNKWNTNAEDYLKKISKEIKISVKIV